MSLQWTLIAGFLYLEIAVVLLLVLPIASPRKWNTFFKSKFLQGLKQQSSIYFMILLAILVLFLLDAIREMRKYSTHDDEHDHKHLDAEMQGNMRLFRAQRNFYISGFALFLSLVIRRLVILISTQASLQAQSEAAMKQAQSATTAAKSLMSQQKDGKESKDDDGSDEMIANLKKQIKELEEELKLENKDKLAMKEQAQNLGKEYDRLTEEYSKLMKTITTTNVASGDNKKDH